MNQMLVQIIFVSVGAENVLVRDRKCPALHSHPSPPSKPSLSQLVVPLNGSSVVLNVRRERTEPKCRFVAETIM